MSVDAMYSGPNGTIQRIISFDGTYTNSVFAKVSFKSQKKVAAGKQAFKKPKMDTFTLQEPIECHYAECRLSVLLMAIHWNVLRSTPKIGYLDYLDAKENNFSYEKIESLVINGAKIYAKDRMVFDKPLCNFLDETQAKTKKCTVECVFYCYYD